MIPRKTRVKTGKKREWWRNRALWITSVMLIFAFFPFTRRLQNAIVELRQYWSCLKCHIFTDSLPHIYTNNHLFARLCVFCVHPFIECLSSIVRHHSSEWENFYQVILSFQLVFAHRFHTKLISMEFLRLLSLFVQRIYTTHIAQCHLKIFFMW